MLASLRPPNAAPNWDALYTVVAAQGGYFTTAQAKGAGYSPQLLHKYVLSGRVQRIRRGIYRLVHFPESDQEDLIVHWLWTDREGVFSHQTALTLHDLSDVLPARVHITLPNGWKRRRLRVPEGLVLHYADVTDPHREWHEVVPVTTPLRTLRDCVDEHLAPDLVQQGIRQARQRGLISTDEETKLSVLLGVSLEVM